MHSQFSNEDIVGESTESQYTSTSLVKFCVLFHFVFLLSPRGILGKKEKLSDPPILCMVGIPDLLVLNIYHTNDYFHT